MEGLEKVNNQKPDLIILDIMLSKMDGIEILKKLKTNPNTEKIPVIMATAKGSEYDKITALNLGADDYLTKPFGMLEMVARIKAVLRRVDGNNTKSIFSNGKIEIREENHLAFVNGEPITLTLKEYDLLLLFLYSPFISSITETFNAFANDSINDISGNPFPVSHLETV